MNDVISAPQWLKDRMAEQRKRPFPTAEQVQRQFESTKKWRKENITQCDYHPHYKGVGKLFDEECHGCLEVQSAQNPDK
jgi:hypothetical protein